MDRAFDRAQGSVICLWVGLSTERVCGRGVAGVDTACRRPVRVTQALSTESVRTGLCGQGVLRGPTGPTTGLWSGWTEPTIDPVLAYASGYLYQP